MSNIFGTKINNLLHGTSGDDIFAGLGGNDTLIGYAGTDTAWYGGLVKDYLLGTSGGYLTVTDRNLADGDDGSDRLTGIEQLTFSNGGLQVTGGEFRVNTYTANEQSNSWITALSDGGFVIIWRSDLQDGSSFGIYGQRYDATGQAVGNEFHVSSNTEDSQSYPSVAALADGGFVAIWHSTDHDGTGMNIFGQRYDAAGLTVGGQFEVNTETSENQYLPSVTALADGGFVVAWQSLYQDGSATGIYCQRYDAGGVRAGVEFQVNTTTADFQSYTSVAALADGGFVVTWQSNNQDGAAYGIYGQRYDAGGTAVGSEFRINTCTTDSQIYPSVAALADGGFVVTWQSNGQDGSGLGVYGQRYDAGGNADGSEFRINSHTAGDQADPSVAALSDGGFVVAWDSGGQDGSGTGIYAQRYDAAGIAVGSEFQVNTYTSADQTRPSVTTLADGGFVVTWTSYGQDGDVSGIYAQRYDAAGDPVGFKVTGSAGADIINIGEQTLLTIDGAAGNDTLTGGNGDDILLGGTGNDILAGGKGDDRLDGGTGNDTMTGGDGSDTYVVDSALDVVTETGTIGCDSVEASISYVLGATLENLTLTGSANLSAIGNASGNFLVGNSGDNILDGKAGGDLMAGGDGNDTYMVDSPFDLVSEDPGRGTDTVKAAVSYTLGDNVENLVLTGTLAIDGSGNALANIIDGNAAANTLTGGDGDDTVRGGAGNDTLLGGDGDDILVGGAGADLLTGGAGADTFRFDQAPAATSVDHVTDFASGTDQIDLAQSIFTQLGGPGALNAADFASGTTFAATDAHHLLYNTGTGGLYYNADGAGNGAPVLIATLDGHPALTAADCFVV